MLFTKFVMLAMLVAVTRSQRYRDPCNGVDCGDYGCCRRYDGYYANHILRYRKYRCVCDEGYYWDNSDDTCKLSCSRSDCHSNSRCYHKERGSLDYPGSNVYDGYRNNDYYCRCNDGYSGNGRQCDFVDPCDPNPCGDYTTCHQKRSGASVPRGGYGSRGNDYYCRCIKNYRYYPADRRCRPYCYGNNCHEYATCRPKEQGASIGHPIYRREYYYCVCNDPYEGNGRQCMLRNPCDPNPCGDYTTCHQKRSGAAVPRGGYGSTGNDYYCRCIKHYRYYPADRRCRPYCYGNDCHREARCTAKEPRQAIGHPIYFNEYYYCRCNPGYEGNGRICRLEDPCDPNPCGVYTTCHSKRSGAPVPRGGYGSRGSDYYCRCIKNYEYHPADRRCVLSDPCNPNPCGDYTTCHSKRSGAIVPRGGYGSRGSDYYCRCIKNYEYHPADRRCVLNDCCSPNPCHEHAICYAKNKGDQYEGYGNYRGFISYCYYCRCRPGYFGNGKICLRFVG